MAESSPSSSQRPSAVPPPAQPQTSPQESNVTGPATSSAPASTSVSVKQEQPDPAEGTQELDATIDHDIDMNAAENIQDNVPEVSNEETKTADAAEAGTEAAGPGVIPADVDPLAAAAPPSKKETSLREFLGKMDEYAPIVRKLLFPFHFKLQEDP